MSIHSTKSPPSTTKTVEFEVDDIEVEVKVEQISLIPSLFEGEDAEELKRQAEEFAEHAKQKRKWEYAFQKWSNFMAYGEGSVDGYGCCGYGSMCDYCEDNSYGRPCVRALNAMCREKGIKIDYTNYDFKEIW